MEIDSPSFGNEPFSGSTTSGGSLRPLRDLVRKLNETFVTAGELDDILNAVLAGTTSGEGLGFNRAFLFIVSDDGHTLEGRCGLGPGSPEEAGRIWHEIAREDMGLFDILDGARGQLNDASHPMNILATSIKISMEDHENILVRSLIENRSFIVARHGGPGIVESSKMCELLGNMEFAVAPLFAHGAKYGVIVADNLYTENRISEHLLYSLDLFVGLGSIAICQSKICRTLEGRMKRLQEINKAVEEQKHLLVETEKFSAIGMLLDRLLHEMKNPLSAIGGISTVMRRKESDPLKREYLDTIIRESEKLEQTLSRIAELQDSGPMSMELVDLGSTVRVIVAMFKAEIEEIGIALHENYPEAAVTVMADVEKFKQAVLNILRNSLEAMPDGGVLVIVVARKGDDAELRISDSGLGIARGHFRKVDNPFFTTKFHSLGLGLSRSKQIIEQHGGTLRLTTNRIGGTTCIISIPRVITD